MDETAIPTQGTIGVFDSGTGGLTVLVELMRILPEERFVFSATQRIAPLANAAPTRFAASLPPPRSSSLARTPS